MTNNLEFRADLVYGATHTRKTTNVGMAAEFFHSTLGLKSHMWTADGGGLEPVSLLIKKGILEVQTLDADTDNPIERMTKASRGEWPNAQGKMAPCTEPLGIVAFEGIYSLGELILARLRHQGVKLQQGPSFSYAEGSSVFHGANMTYYGFAQELLRDSIKSSHKIANAQRVIWTSLEDAADNETTMRREGGPASPGNKMVTRTVQSFCNTMRLTKEGDSHCLYTTRHNDKNGIEFPAGVRVPYQFADKIPKKLENGTIADIYRLLAQVNPSTNQQGETK
ncbi:MAG: hypothetical protein ACREKE_08460 [bacterium]